MSFYISNGIFFIMAFDGSTSTFYYGYYVFIMIIALISTIAASSFMSNNMVSAQTQPTSGSHSHLPGFFYNPQDPFHSIFPIRNVETSQLLDKAGDAVSTSGIPAQS